MRRSVVEPAGPLEPDEVVAATVEAVSMVMPVSTWFDLDDLGWQFEETRWVSESGVYTSFQKLNMMIFNAHCGLLESMWED